EGVGGRIVQLRRCEGLVIAVLASCHEHCSVFQQGRSVVEARGFHAARRRREGLASRFVQLRRRKTSSRQEHCSVFQQGGGVVRARGFHAARRRRESLAGR